MLPALFRQRALQLSAKTDFIRTVFSDKGKWPDNIRKRKMVDKPIQEKRQQTQHDKECVQPILDSYPKQKPKTKEFICGPSVLDKIPEADTLQKKKNKQAKKSDNVPSTIRYFKKGNVRSASVVKPAYFLSRPIPLIDYEKPMGRKYLDRFYGTSRPIPVIKVPLPKPPALPRGYPLTQKIQPSAGMSDVNTRTTCNRQCGRPKKRIHKVEIRSQDQCVPPVIPAEYYEPTLTECSKCVKKPPKNDCRPKCKKPCHGPPDIRFFPKD